MPQCTGNPVVTRIDNSGAYWIDKKGYNLKCELLDYLIRVTAFVATALATEVRVVKIRRCSTPGAIAADMISKANFALHRKLITKYTQPCRSKRQFGSYFMCKSKEITWLNYNVYVNFYP